jgi:hypothetical protein
MPNYLTAYKQIKSTTLELGISLGVIKYIGNSQQKMNNLIIKFTTEKGLFHEQQTFDSFEEAIQFANDYTMPYRQKSLFMKGDWVINDSEYPYLQKATQQLVSDHEIIMNRLRG